MLLNRYDIIKTLKRELVFYRCSTACKCVSKRNKCRFGDDCHSNFRLQLRSNGVNYVTDFLSQTAGVSQFADGGIKVGQVQWSTSCACPLPPCTRRGAMSPPRPAACLWNLAVRLALRLATEFEHTMYSEQAVTYYKLLPDCCSCDKVGHQRISDSFKE